jgi:hypothetical protein
MTNLTVTPQLVLLSTNSNTLKERELEFKSSEISIAVLLEDLENLKENPIFYAYRYGMIYDPNEDFKPNVAGNQKIKGQLVADYWKMEDNAKAEYKKRLEAEKAKRGEKAGNTNTVEINELRRALEEQREQVTNKNRSIMEKNLIIEELRKENAKKTEKGPSELEQMQLMIKSLHDIQSNRIEIRHNQTIKVMETIVHESFKDIIDLISADEAVYLYGPAGTGKSKLAEQIAEALDLNFYPASTITQEFKLSGFIDGSGRYHQTNFYKAFVNGGLFFLDEMDSCSEDVLVGINGALANGYYDFPNGTEYAHDDFRVISAGNTIGRGATQGYSGRRELDLSTLDRFLSIELNYSPKIDMASANNDQELFDFAQAIRSASKNSGINILCSYRSIGKIVKLQGMDKNLTDILKWSILKGVASDDMEMLMEHMTISTENKYYKALKKAV